MKVFDHQVSLFLSTTYTPKIEFSGIKKIMIHEAMSREALRPEFVSQKVILDFGL